MGMPATTSSSPTAADRVAALAEKARTGATEQISLGKQRAVDGVKATKDETLELASDKSAQVTVASAAGGAVVVGAGAAGAGVFVGGAIGAALGVIPSLFTFGLSIPIGAVLGSCCGAVVGGSVGGATGLVGAGTAGYGAYTKREEIGALVSTARTFAEESFSSAKATVLSRVEIAKAKVTGTYALVQEHVVLAAGKTSNVYTAAKDRTLHAAEVTKTKTVEIASDRAVQVTAASATGGAIALGTGGAATGLLAGAATGAAVGLIPALFTFGLSIPVFAIIGGGCGAVTGTAVGGTVGLVGGGATGYGVHTRRDAIGSSVNMAASKADDSAKDVKEAASHSAS